MCGRNTIFSNANLKSSKLDEHLKNQHGGSDAGYDIDSLKVKRARFDSSGTLSAYGFLLYEKPLLLASYKVAYSWLKKKSPIQ